MPDVERNRRQVVLAVESAAEVSIALKCTPSIPPNSASARSINRRAESSSAGLVVLADRGAALVDDEGDGAVGRGLVEITDHHLGALGRQPPRGDPADRGADPGAVTGAAGAHHDDLVLNPRTQRNVTAFKRR